MTALTILEIFRQSPLDWGEPKGGGKYQDIYPKNLKKIQRDKHWQKEKILLNPCEEIPRFSCWLVPNGCTISLFAVKAIYYLCSKKNFIVANEKIPKPHMHQDMFMHCFASGIYITNEKKVANLDAVFNSK